MNKDLSENSIAYYDEANIYKAFSEAEDYPDKAFESIAFIFNNKIVLDLGCGNGKYSFKIGATAKQVYAIDKSFNQLDHFALRKDNIFPILSDIATLPLLDHSVDIIFSSWVIGTINNLVKQLQVLNEIKKILKPDGKIILFENAVGSEFEALRGRYPDPHNRTKTYNEWLIKQGFEIKNLISTHFKFENQEKANSVFKAIWGDRLMREVQSSTIEHEIIIFEYKKVINNI